MSDERAMMIRQQLIGMLFMSNRSFLARQLRRPVQGTEQDSDLIFGLLHRQLVEIGEADLSQEELDWNEEAQILLQKMVLNHKPDQEKGHE